MAIPSSIISRYAFVPTIDRDRERETHLRSPQVHFSCCRHKCVGVPYVYFSTISFITWLTRCIYATFIISSEFPSIYFKKIVAASSVSNSPIITTKRQMLSSKFLNLKRPFRFFVSLNLQLSHCALGGLSERKVPVWLYCLDYNSNTGYCYLLSQEVDDDKWSVCHRSWWWWLGSCFWNLFQSIITYLDSHLGDQGHTGDTRAPRTRSKCVWGHTTARLHLCHLFQSWSKLNKHLF